MELAKNVNPHTMKGRTSLKKSVADFHKNIKHEALESKRSEKKEHKKKKPLHMFQYLKTSEDISRAMRGE